MGSIEANLDKVRVRIRTACAAASRDVASVALLAVSKTFPAEAVRAAASAGQRAFGENYVQEGVEKILALRDAGLDLEWHCIGPIQSNKTRLVAEHFDWVHTVDRTKIAERLSQQRPEGLAPLHVCVQVNIDGSPTKSGVAPVDALTLCEAIARLPRLVLRGIMLVPDPPDPGATISVAINDPYTSGKALFDQIFSAQLPGAERFDTLSLGMSADLEAAVRAGSTMVRVGSAIFGSRGAG
ncbi:MAG: YggS family pyridoxal phosphate-dependent enzyme [Burkholderiales bacterium]